MKIHPLRAGIVATAVFAALSSAVPAVSGAAEPGLPRLEISANYVTGVSSGGYLATQLQVAYSAAFAGAGVVAAGPYFCGQGRLLVGALACGSGIVPEDVSALVERAESWSREGRIDPVDNLGTRRIYGFHGTWDPVVSATVNDAGMRFYQDFGAPVRYDDTVPAGHSWVTPQGVVPCRLTAPPFLNDCGVDPQGAMLDHWLGSVNPPNTGPPTGTLLRFDQNRYVPGGSAAAHSMDTTGLLYTPASCAAGRSCRLVVALHGCVSGQSLLGTLFSERGNLNTYADTNDLVILYPQAVPSLHSINPMGCWDWWGYTTPDYAVKGAPQMAAITEMVRALGGPMS
jgi:poly(3-hydroxybutyrate) depolymerase